MLSRWTALWKDPPIAPAAPFYAVGDIHGCFDLFQALLSKLEPEIPVICVGDYIDRGPHSAQVLRFLQMHPEITCLMGNHEVMLLRFLDDPDRGAPWLRYGGVETLESFDIAVPQGPEEHAENLRNQLAQAMGADLISWIRARPAFWQSGNMVVTHAGADPRGPIEAQDSKHLIWGHPDFPRLRRRDGLWLVHGHVIEPAPLQQRGHINIDTGAFATGRLTAAHIVPAQITFLEACG